jgi:hypothetical protein
MSDEITDVGNITQSPIECGEFDPTRQCESVLPDGAVVPRQGGYIVPFRKGQSGNPKGRPSVGATVKERMNQMRTWTEDRIRKVARDPSAPYAQRAAAIQLLESLRVPDMADFDDILSNRKSLRQARDSGVDTSSVKKVKRRKRTDEHGETEEIELELHPSKASEALERIMDRTDGKPVQTQITQVEHIVDPVSMLERMRSELGIVAEVKPVKAIDVDEV